MSVIEDAVVMSLCAQTDWLEEDEWILPTLLDCLEKWKLRTYVKH